MYPVPDACLCRCVTCNSSVMHFSFCLLTSEQGQGYLSWKSAHWTHGGCIPQEQILKMEPIEIMCILHELFEDPPLPTLTWILGAGRSRKVRNASSLSLSLTLQQVEAGVKECLRTLFWVFLDSLPPWPKPQEYFLGQGLCKA